MFLQYIHINENVINEFDIWDMLIHIMMSNLVHLCLSRWLMVDLILAVVAFAVFWALPASLEAFTVLLLTLRVLAAADFFFLLLAILLLFYGLSYLQVLRRVLALLTAAFEGITGEAVFEAVTVALGAVVLVTIALYFPLRCRGFSTGLREAPKVFCHEQKLMILRHMRIFHLLWPIIKALFKVLLS